MAQVLMARTIKAVIKAHRGLDQRANVLHFIVDGLAVTPADVDQVAAAVAAWVPAHYIGFVSNQVLFDSVDCQDVSVADGYQKSISLVGTNGQETSAPLPGNACGVCTLKTAQAGRQGRGRVFLFDTGAAYTQTNETFTAGYASGVQAAFTSLMTAPGPTGAPRLAVGSKKGACSFEVTSVIGRSYIASQRDRLPGHRARRRRHTPTP